MNKETKLYNKLTIISYIVVVLLMVIFNIIIFAAYETIINCSTNVFWLTWSFTFPVNLLLVGAVLLFFLKAKGNIVIKAPVFIFLIGYEVISLILACCFFFIPNKEIVAAGICESVLTILFIVGLLYFYGAFSFVRHNQEVVKENVAFIKGLNVIVLGYANESENEEEKKALNDLADAIRYSDPMTVNETRAMDEEIANNVKAMSELVNNDAEALLKLVKATENKLKTRNELLKISK